jgi:hypothetical protein
MGTHGILQFKYVVVWWVALIRWIWCGTDFFGEISFLLGEGASGSVVAGEGGAEVVSLGGDFVNILLSAKPLLASRFFKYPTSPSFLLSFILDIIYIPGSVTATKAPCFPRRGFELVNKVYM